MPTTQQVGDGFRFMSMRGAIGIAERGDMMKALQGALLC